jgi:hypothetical protein
MVAGSIDLDRLRRALQAMSRGDLLIIAERAAELVPKAKLEALCGDYVRVGDLATTGARTVSVLAKVRKFHAASLHGDYYESVDIDATKFMDQSKGTDAFVAEFQRLLGKCIRAAAKGPRAPAREAFELLFGVLRHIDECQDDVIFFSDEPGSWKVYGNWRPALAGYFQCLADTASPTDFAREVDRVIKDFAERERPHHLAAAQRVASSEQVRALLAEMVAAR